MKILRSVENWVRNFTATAKRLRYVMMLYFHFVFVTRILQCIVVLLNTYRVDGRGSSGESAERSAQWERRTIKSSVKGLRDEVS